jgi:DNA/RNA endonuclease YhcR with UshA esterase domain
VAERQAALAGYRLADEIRDYLKCGSVVPLLPANTNIFVQIAIPSKIGTAEAAKYYDETLVVTGKVVEVSVRPTITILDLDQPYPNTLFTAVVFPENASQFGDLQRFKNQNVEISGTVTEYRGKPEVILETPGQIKALEIK